MFSKMEKGDKAAFFETPLEKDTITMEEIQQFATLATRFPFRGEFMTYKFEDLQQCREHVQHAYTTMNNMLELESPLFPDGFIIAFNINQYTTIRRTRDLLFCLLQFIDLKIDQDRDTSVSVSQTSE